MARTFDEALSGDVTEQSSRSFDEAIAQSEVAKQRGQRSVDEILETLGEFDSEGLPPDTFKRITQHDDPVEFLPENLQELIWHQALSQPLQCPSHW